MSAWSELFDPHVEKHLIEEQGEFIVDEVRKHFLAHGKGIGLVLAGGLCFLLMAVAGPFFWLPLLAGIAFAGWGLFEIQLVHMDRFVITNTRVFRVHGILDRHMASMPMKRVLDVSFNQGVLGRMLDFGDFVFESAAQEQGLRVITYVARPLDRDRTIQRVLSASGLHARVDID